jgi:hypothetical protein
VIRSMYGPLGWCLRRSLLGIDYTVAIVQLLLLLVLLLVLVLGLVLLLLLLLRREIWQILLLPSRRSRHGHGGGGKRRETHLVRRWGKSLARCGRVRISIRVIQGW